MVIFEVLSKTTEGYDRGDKFEHFRAIESLADVVLIAQDKVHVEHYTRQTGGQWLLSETNDLRDKIVLAPIDCALALHDVYRKVSVG
jgi:Uma2 family endonuclease